MQILPTFGISNFQVVDMRAETHKIVLTAVISTPAAQCPNCQQWSQSIHSRYVRHLADLPWSGIPIQIKLQVADSVAPHQTVAITISLSVCPKWQFPIVAALTDFRSGYLLCH